MRRIYVFTFLFIISGLTVLQAQDTFRATLSGRHEVLPVLSNGTGSIEAVLDGNELTVTGSFSGLDGMFDPTVAGGSHLHIGYAGENGPVAISLVANTSLDLRSGTYEAASNTYTLTEEQVTALRERRMYVNIHTTKFGGGELRGQLLPASDATYFINLLGSNEVPSAMTQASGALTLEVRNDSLFVSGAFSGLEGDFDASIAGGAHLHTGMAGENAGVDILLNATTDADLKGGVFAAADNGFALEANQMAMLEARGYYANLHSTTFPGGELRGQVTGMAQAVFRAHLSGMNENPVVVSDAGGQVLGELHGDSLIVHGSFDGLESPVAVAIAGGLHLHVGAAGSNGPVAIPLTADFDADQQGGALNAATNTYTLDSDARAALMARGIYLNIHSNIEQSGEIRGQMLPEAQIVFHGNLNGVQEVPDVTTTAYGAIKGELNGDILTVSGSYNGLSALVDVSIAGGAHLHQAAAGATGGVDFVLTSDFDLDMTAGAFTASNNSFELDSAQVAALRARKYYANIHTLDFGGGELRAQLLAEANYYFTTPLSGSVEVPTPIDTDARGLFIFEVRNESMVGVGSLTGLSSAIDTDIAGGAHLHAGMAGQAGPVVKLLNLTIDGGTSATLEASDNVIEMTSGQLDTLRDRGFYANIHTMNFAAGELRGQTLPMANAYLMTTLAGINEVQPVMTGASGGLALELNGDVLTTTGSFANLESAFDANIAGGAHLHTAGPGANGGVDILLNTDVSMDTTAGVYRVDNNSDTLTESQIMTFLDGGYYANIHTTGNPSGELRGQVLPQLNFFPDNAPAITAPADGVELTLEGALSTLLNISWMDSAEDDTEVAYIWQAAIDADFDTLVFQANTGANASLDLTYGALDTLLASLGVQAGATATVYHRVVATDGSNQTAGMGAVANFTRSTATNTQNLLADGSSFMAYPTVTTGNVRLEARLRDAGAMEVIIMNAVGQPVQRIRTIGTGERLQENIDLSGRAAGMYWIQLRVDGQAAATQRVLLRN